MGDRKYSRLHEGDEALLDIGGSGILVRVFVGDQGELHYGLIRVTVSYDEKKNPVKMIAAPTDILIGRGATLIPIPNVDVVTIPGTTSKVRLAPPPQKAGGQPAGPA